MNEPKQAYKVVTARPTLSTFTLAVSPNSSFVNDMSKSLTSWGKDLKVRQRVSMQRPHMRCDCLGLEVGRWRAD